MCNFRDEVQHYAAGCSYRPLFLCGDALLVLRELPDETIDFCMTSPPYWNQREYHNGGIGLEATYAQYIESVLAVFSEVKRVLKSTGSFWLNIGDTYVNKGLVGVPWRLALAMIDEQKWILRNDVVWNKIKGPDNSNDKLRNVHEYVLHFVKQHKGFYYNVDAIWSKPREAHVKNGAVISATGVSGVRYKRQIELSTALTAQEKDAALAVLNATLDKVARGELCTFAWLSATSKEPHIPIRKALSGRAKELQQRGFYILNYHPGGSKPPDVWDIIPEDTQNRDDHYAAYPEDLCKVPLLATCPPRRSPWIPSAARARPTSLPCTCSVSPLESIFRRNI